MKELMKLFFSAIWKFIHPFLKQLLTEEGKIIMQTAVECVSLIEDQIGGSKGPIKQSAAYKLILQRLKKQSIDASTSTVNACLEAAVQYIKNKE